MFAEFDKVVRCLALELPESVHADVVAKYGKLKADVEKFTSTNSAMVPCPGHRKGNVCEIHAHDWLCGNVPCMLSVAQHQ